MDLQEAIVALHRRVKAENAVTASDRLSGLGAFCMNELTRRGISGVAAEKPIRGWVRTKNWDLVWEVGGRPRLGISLKSILGNLGGAVPNRTDDLIGEAADVQMRYPEIAIGYVVVMDVSQDSPPGSGGKWITTMRERLARLSGRRAPFWTQGSVESSLVLEVDFSGAPKVVTPTSQVSAFFDALATELKSRL